jgi:decaprenyl-phosphate phosphoribosyltransferase
MMLHFSNLLRLHQWTKNLFLFLPIFFAGQFFYQKPLIQTLLGFFCFSLTASAVYILNDLLDYNSDKNHPEKSKRPIASGKINRIHAAIIGFVILCVGLTSGFFLSKPFALLLLCYFLMNVAYSSYLKHIPIVDVTIIAIGFTLRIAAGGLITNIPISHWITIMTFLLAMFMAFGKRRDDILIFINSGSHPRKASKGYNLEFIHVAMALMAAISIVAYLMYTLSPEVVERFQTQHLYITSLFVLLGFLRYFQQSIVNQNSGNPTRLFLKDHTLQFIMAIWMMTFFFIVYAPKIFSIFNTIA